MAEPKRIEIDDVRPGGRHVVEVEVPGWNKPVGIMVLRAGEVQRAHFSTVDYFERKAQPRDGVSLGEFMREKERQEVYYMVLRGGSKKASDRLFVDADQVRESLNLDEIMFFQGEHEKIQRKLLRDLGFSVEGEEE